MAEFVRLEVEDGIGTIRLDRPPMNALNRQVQASSPFTALGIEVAPSFPEQLTFDEPSRITYRHAPPTGQTERAGADGVDRARLPKVQKHTHRMRERPAVAVDLQPADADRQREPSPAGAARVDQQQAGALLYPRPVRVAGNDHVGGRRQGAPK